MNFFKEMYKIATLLVVIFAFAACDDDFSSVGGEIIENPTDVALREVEVNAYSRKINSVQTNNLGDNLLGVYNSAVYGQTTASILTQLSLGLPNPSFGNEPQLDSVVLTIPYYSTEGESDEEGNIQYELDSIYGNSPFSFSIYESNYFLSDFDPEADFRDRQKYYSDQQELFEQHLVGEPIYQNNSFLPSAEPIVTFEENDEGENDTIVSAPALRIQLPVEFFQEKIINREGSDVLSNNNNFRNYLRGLFIKAEPVDGDGSLIQLDLQDPDAGITLYYTRQVEDEEEEETVGMQASYGLDFGSNIVNTFEEDFSPQVLQEIENADTENGEERLYLKGGEGSMAVIELFEDEAELEELRENFENGNWLINEANLTFFVDQEALSENNHPERLYLWDLTNNRIIADYIFSATPVAQNGLGDYIEGEPRNSMTTFSSSLKSGENEAGSFYKIFLGRYVAQVLSGDSENVKIGLAITQNINNTTNSAVSDASGEEITRVPAMSVISPKGTILYGDEAEDEEKRLKLRIYYTSINEE